MMRRIIVKARIAATNAAALVAQRQGDLPPLRL